jgi:[ribosomal protein S5]-alanine N-acetyltransferase
MPESPHIPFPILQTERLLLRQLTDKDAAEIFALHSDKNVNKYLNRKPCNSLDDAKSFIQMILANEQKNDSVYWAIGLRGTDTLIGTICLYDISASQERAEIGFELLPGYQGKGFMQEAVLAVIRFGKEQLGLQLIEAFTHAGNQASIRLLQKCRFQQGSVDKNPLMLLQWRATTA